MKERERILVFALVVLMLVTWLGFTVHQSPRFAGSLWGGLLAIAGSGLMLVPLAYMIVKRVPWLKRGVSKHWSMRSFLTWHIYAGVLGPLLVVLHTGHKFESPLGISLTAMTLLVVVSGFVGRYLMTYISQELREKHNQLEDLRKAYKTTALELQDSSEATSAVRLLGNPLVGLASWFSRHNSGQQTSAAFKATRIAESMADLEFAIRTHETFKKVFAAWLRTHIVLSLVLYLLMGLHVWASIHFGLRWFA